MLPPGSCSQQAGTILPTLMLSRRAMPPDTAVCSFRERAFARMIGNSNFIEMHVTTRSPKSATKETSKSGEAGRLPAASRSSALEPSAEQWRKSCASPMPVPAAHPHLQSQRRTRRNRIGFRAMWFGPKTWIPCSNPTSTSSSNSSAASIQPSRSCAARLNRASRS